MLRLQQERQARGWSIAELARRTGLNASTLGIVEKGRFKPYPAQLRKMAAAFGQDVAQAASLAEEVDPLPVREVGEARMPFIETIRSHRYRFTNCSKHGAVKSGLAWRGPHLGEFCPNGCYLTFIVQSPEVLVLAPSRPGA